MLGNDEARADYFLKLVSRITKKPVEALRKDYGFPLTPEETEAILGGRSLGPLQERITAMRGALSRLVPAEELSVIDARLMSHPGEDDIAYDLLRTLAQKTNRSMSEVFDEFAPPKIPVEPQDIVQTTQRGIKQAQKLGITPREVYPLLPSTSVQPPVEAPVPSTVATGAATGTTPVAPQPVRGQRPRLRPDPLAGLSGTERADIAEQTIRTSVPKAAGIVVPVSREYNIANEALLNARASGAPDDVIATLKASREAAFNRLAGVTQKAIDDGLMTAAESKALSEAIRAAQIQAAEALKKGGGGNPLSTLGMSGGGAFSGFAKLAAKHPEFVKRLGSGVAGAVLSGTFDPFDDPFTSAAVGFGAGLTGPDLAKILKKAVFKPSDEIGRA